MILELFVVSFWWRVPMGNPVGIVESSRALGKIESCAARNPWSWRWCAGVCAAGGGCVGVRGATGGRCGSSTGWTGWVPAGGDLYRTSGPTSAKFGAFKVVPPTPQAKLYGN